MLLGAVFLVSGAAKLADRQWPASARAFGVAEPIARAVPPVELVLGAALVAGLGGPWPALVGAGLLVVFTIAIVLVLRRDGDAPACACFGGWSRRPVSGRTVLRNVALLVVALVALAA